MLQMCVSSFAGLHVLLASFSSAVGGIKQQLPSLHLAFHLEIWELSQVSRLFSFYSFLWSYLRSFCIFRVPKQGKTKKKNGSFSLLPNIISILSQHFLCACILSVALFVLKCKNILALFFKNNSQGIIQT